MLYFVTGDMFDRPAQARVNTVNCVGIMGKGVARNFARRYPAMLQAYKKACAAHFINPGFVWPWLNHAVPGEVIFNMATKNHWIEPSKYGWVGEGITSLAAMVLGFRPRSLTMPFPGCGNGGLDPVVVKKLIIRDLADLPADIYVYEPGSK